MYIQNVYQIRYVLLAFAFTTLLVQIVLFMKKRLYQVRVLNLIFFFLVSYTAEVMSQLFMYHNTPKCRFLGFFKCAFIMTTDYLALVITINFFVLILRDKYLFKNRSSELLSMYKLIMTFSCIILGFVDILQITPLIEKAYQITGWHYQEEMIQMSCNLSTIVQDQNKTPVLIYQSFNTILKTAQLIFASLTIFPLYKKENAPVILLRDQTIAVNLSQGYQLCIAFCLKNLITLLLNYVDGYSMTDANIFFVTLYQLCQISNNTCWGIVFSILCYRIYKHLEDTETHLITLQRSNSQSSERGVSLNKVQDVLIGEEISKEKQAATLYSTPYKDLESLNDSHNEATFKFFKPQK